MAADVTVQLRAPLVAPSYGHQLQELSPGTVSSPALKLLGLSSQATAATPKKYTRRSSAH
jgi:hypothetical protein